MADAEHERAIVAASVGDGDVRKAAAMAAEAVDDDVTLERKIELLSSAVRLLATHIAHTKSKVRVVGGQVHLG